MYLSEDFLIATVQLDPHTDAVIDELETSEFSVFRLNTDKLRSDYKFSAVGEHICITDTLGRSFSTNVPNPVGYYRKPRIYDTARGNKSENLVASEFNGFMLGVFSHQGIHWVNNRWAILKAQSKIGQYRVARSVGFNCPKTLVTNDVKKATSFVKMYKDIAIKPVVTPSIADEHDSVHFFTKRISHEELMPMLDRVNACPVIIQQYVKKQYELRVTIFGKTVFACKLNSQSVEKAKHDWRAINPAEIEHEVVDLDSKIINKCKAMLKLYNLDFGAFDFIVGVDGDVYFLEVNPNGQWYWIELMTGAKMARAMADLLIHKKRGDSTCV